MAAPWLYRPIVRWVGHLPTESRVRQILISQSIRSGWGAFNRRDLELMLVRYAPDCEFITAPGLQTLGVESSLRGHDALRRYVDAITEAWEHWEFVAPRAFIDFGDRVLTFGFQRAEGSSSHTELQDEFAQLAQLERGLITHQETFNNWDAGLQAVGLQRSQVWGLDELLATHKQSRPAV